MTQRGGANATAMMEVLQLAALRVMERQRQLEGQECSVMEYFAGARFWDANRGLIPFEQWPHLVTLLNEWEKKKSGVVLKARQLGVSWAVAVYAAWVARRPGALVLLLSQGQMESFELLRKVKDVLQEHRTHPVELHKDAEGSVEILGGGKIVALPSTARAGRGYTATLVIADEAAYHPYAEDNYVAYKPALDGGGQLLVVSTANGNLGFFSDMYWGAVQGANGYEHWFLPWHLRPGRDEAWLKRERKAFRGLPAEFKQEYPDTPEDAFVSLTGLVYPQFHVDRHVARNAVAWEQNKWRLAGVDFGGGDPTAIVPMGVSWDDHVHQYGEFYRAGPVTIEEIGSYLWTLHRIAPFHAILADPSQQVAIASLRSLGLPVYPADNRRGEGLGNVAWLLDNNRLTIDDRCEHSIGEFHGYRWKESIDPNSKERFATSTPVDHHADAMDARRYAVMHIIKSIQSDHSGHEMKVLVRG